MIKMWWRVVLVALVGAIPAGGCEYFEITEHYYADYHALQAAQEPGNWVPKFIPLSAVNIHVKSKVDTGAEILAFSMPDGEPLSLVGYCTVTGVGEVQFLPRTFAGVDWWPDVLTDEGRLHDELIRYRLYRCQDRGFLALRQEADSYAVFYWQIRFTARSSE